MKRLKLKNLIIIIFLLGGVVKGEYIEGIDTTDEKGITKDSAFTIQNPSFIIINNNYEMEIIARYCNFGGECNGYFNYTFDEVMIAPFQSRFPYMCTCEHFKDTIKGIDEWKKSVFVVRDKRDSTYSKYQVIKKLSDGRYVYRYGKNTNPNDRLLVKSDYDRSKKYNVNNMYLNYYACKEEMLGTKWVCDENNPHISFYPPIPSNNKLIGYILYSTKPNLIELFVERGIRPTFCLDPERNIDPEIMNSLEWDSVMFIKELNPEELTERKIIVDYEFLPLLEIARGFFNIVAVYEEGKSDFLEGWTLCLPSRVGSIMKKEKEKRKSFEIGIKKNRGGIILHIINKDGQQDPNEQTKIEIFSIAGEILSRGEVKNNSLFLRLSKNLQGKGIYIVKISTGERFYTQLLNINMLR